MKLLGTHIMIDVETMGIGTAPPLLSLGAVAFNDGGIFLRFHEHIDLQSCIDAGLVPTASTMLWWLEQSDEARQKITQGQKDSYPVGHVLGLFFNWIYDVYEGLAEDCFVWSYGSNADIRWLDEICEKLNINTPWSYRNIGCYRTLCHMFPMVPYNHRGVRHDALADAKSQANHLIEMFKYDECVSKAAYANEFAERCNMSDDSAYQPGNSDLQTSSKAPDSLIEVKISTGVGPSSLKG